MKCHGSYNSATEPPTMKEVRIHKNELLEKLRSNRSKHADEYRLAFEKYLSAYESKLWAMMREKQEVERGNPEKKVLSHNLNLTPPIDNTDEYDRFIQMLEMSTDEIITLSADEFNALVRDEWTWKHHAHAINSAYILGN